MAGKKNKAVASRQSTVSKAPFHLPIEIAIEILSRSPVKSLLRFKSVCKTWYALIKSPIFISKHLTLSSSTLNSNFNSTTLLLITKFGYPHNLGMYLQHNNYACDALIKIDFPFLNAIHNLCIVGICNGLVCLRLSNSDSLILSNPATRQFRKIPDYKWWDDNVTEIEWLTFRFGFHPKADDYVLIRIVYHNLNADRRGKLLVRIDMFTMATDTWRELDVTMPSTFEDEVYYPFEVDDTSAAAFVNGVLYWEIKNLLSAPCFVSLDLGEEVFRKIEMPDRVNEFPWELLEFKDKLAMIKYNPPDFRWFDVWVLNEDQRSWTNQFRVGPFADPTGYWINGKISLEGCAKNGEMVLRVRANGDIKLYLYDPKSQEIKNLPFRQALHPYYIHMYVETLLPVKKNNEC